MANTAGQKDEFELGLVMAGAVSAGAFTAGVLDFLMQALDAWYDEKAADAERPEAQRTSDLPPHAIRLTVMTGSSAGGMCAALGAIAMGEQFNHATGPVDPSPIAPPPRPGLLERLFSGNPPPAVPPPRVDNRMYKAWVEMIDMEPLLTSGDLIGPGKMGTPVRSAMNGEILDTILAENLKAPGQLRRRAYFGNEEGKLQVILTTTNLRGVPYHLNFQGGGSITRHYMSMHGDHVHFEVSAAEAAKTPALSGAAVAAATGGEPREGKGLKLKLADLAEKPETWKLFAATALATGAFPIGLPPRRVGLTSDVYADRRWRVTTELAEEEERFTVTGMLRSITPDFDKPPPGKDLDFGYLAVDGGATDNEPVELVRSIMRPNRVKGIPGAVVMIDPFPDATNPGNSPDSQRFIDFDFKFTEDGKDVVEPLGPVALVQRIVRSLVNQSRFKPSELSRAADPMAFDQFMVAPSRDGRGPGQTHIACGALAGFSGFLEERFRRHDYYLGRHNCRAFLEKYFALPLYSDVENQVRRPLFANWKPEAIRRHLIVRERLIDESKAEILGKPILGGDAVKLVDWANPAAPVPFDLKLHMILLPIVPLRGTALKPADQPKNWPTLERGAKYHDKARLRGEVKARLKTVLGRIIEKVDGVLIKRALYYVRWQKSGDWSDELVNAMASALKKEGLVPQDW